MCIYIRNFSSSTRCFKYATASIVLALGFYALGFFTLNWSSIYYLNKFTFVERVQLNGLWQRCVCVDGEPCVCEGKVGEQVWLQAVITIYLVGLFISGCIAMHQLFSKRTKKWKRINICVQIISGIIGLCGVTVFGLLTKMEFDWGIFFIEFKYKFIDARNFLSFSYYFCCASVILNLFVSVPLFIIDERIPERVKQKPQVRNNGRAGRKTQSDTNRPVISTVA